MERRYVKAVGGRVNIGSSWVILSLAFLCIGLNVLFRLEEVRLLGAFLSLIGVGAGIAGARSLMGAYETYQNIKYLVSRNNYVWAEITSCEENQRIEVNNAHPRYVVASYTDTAGRTRTFESEETFRTAVQYLVGLKVRVYLGSNVNDYYVDIEQLMEGD